MSPKIVSSAVVVAAMLAGPPLAHAMPMNGTFDIRYDRQTPQPLSPDQVRIDASGSGTNRSPGQPLDNAQVTVTDSVTLTRGQGPVSGTITFTTPDGRVTSRYSGQVTTDAQGRMSGQGTFRAIGGSGAFAGLKGRGTFASAFSSPSEMTSNWVGDFKPANAKVSRR